MRDDDIRLDGWKAIANYLRRSRSAVIRWADEGDLPVRRVGDRPGAAVYAYAHEIEAWLKREGVATSPGVEAPVAMSSDVVPIRRAPFPILSRWLSSRPRWAWSLAFVLGVLATASLVVLVPGRVDAVKVSAAPALPSDPALAELYVRARDDWATRTSSGLHRAIQELGELNAADPGFALGYASLADVYILAPEFAAMPNDVAYPKAEAAAKAALAIDPESAEANRALAFIDYWGHGDLVASKVLFERAIARAPNDAQTRFWLGNVLLNERDDREGFRQLQIASQLNPGSAAIAVDHKMWLWRYDPTPANRQGLQDAVRAAPQLCSGHMFLTWAYLVDGDLKSYLDQREQAAQLQDCSTAETDVAAEKAAFAKAGAQGLLRHIAYPTRLARDSYSELLEWPATAAAMMGDRQKLLQLLRLRLATLDRIGTEHNFSAWRPDQPRFQAARSDPEILHDLARLNALQATPSWGGRTAGPRLTEAGGPIALD